MGEVPGESSHRSTAVLAVPNQRLYALQERHTQLSVAFSWYRNLCGFLQRPTTVAGLVNFLPAASAMTETSCPVSLVGTTPRGFLPTILY